VSYECFSDERVSVVEFDWRESLGGCWARAEAMKLWSGEDWYLQLDSHHRFIDGWDELLLDQADRTRSARPVISTLAPPYVRGQPTPEDTTPYVMRIVGFDERGMITCRASAVENWRDRVEPIRSRMTCGHFLFAPACFICEVPHDPDVYGDEEASVTLRAFTHGYDLFAPSVVTVFHDYSRVTRPNHYDDHVYDNGLEVAWHDRAGTSRGRTRAFLREPWFGPYGLGHERTLGEYEEYAGVSFRHQRLQDYTRDNYEPPNPPTDQDWATKRQDRQIRIVIDRNALPIAAIQEPSFWYVGFHRNGKELYRDDAGAEELATLLAGDSRIITFTRNFQSEAEPTHWTVIPFAENEGWLEGVSSELSEDYLGIRPD
jgi:hypothetical protein